MNRSGSRDSSLLPDAREVTLNNLPQAEWVMALILQPIPIILVGGNRDVEQLEAILQGGKVDFIALYRRSFVSRICPIADGQV